MINVSSFSKFSKPSDMDLDVVESHQSSRTEASYEEEVKLISSKILDTDARISEKCTPLIGSITHEDLKLYSCQTFDQVFDNFPTKQLFRLYIDSEKHA